VSGAKTTGVYVALLRGVNVGGKHVLPMKHLLAMFVDLGCANVRTYIQSGNVVFQARPGLAGRIPAVIAETVSDRFGFKASVATRTAAELGEIVRANPFLRAGAHEQALHVGFLVDRPSAAQVAALDSNRGAPDAFEVRGREIYLHLPNGVARSKLTNAYFDAKLGTTCTVRNWRTVLKLLEIATATSTGG